MRGRGLEGELAVSGEIGAVARWHYTFMGAHPRPQMFEDTGSEVGRLLAEVRVDSVVLPRRLLAEVRGEG